MFTFSCVVLVQQVLPYHETKWDYILTFYLIGTGFAEKLVKDLIHSSRILYFLMFTDQNTQLYSSNNIYFRKF